MILRMLELLYSPFLLLLILRNAGNKPSSGNIEAPRSTTPAPPVIIKPIINNASQCPLFSERSVAVLFYDHPDHQIRGCYENESKGPCGENTQLYLINGTETRNGECDCNQSSPRMLLYHTETNQCYPIFHQIAQIISKCTKKSCDLIKAYCETGEQLVITPEKPSKPVCKRTACYEQLKDSVNAGKDLVPIMNNTACVQVGSACKREYIVAFERSFGKWKPFPSCVPPRLKGLSNLRAIGVPRVRCSPGSYRAISGHCQPEIFSFDDWD